MLLKRREDIDHPLKETITYKRIHIIKSMIASVIELRGILYGLPELNTRVIFRNRKKKRRSQFT